MTHPLRSGSALSVAITTRPRFSSRRWSAIALAVAAMWLASCGSPLVGLECRDGFTRCGHGCYDLTSDEDHCGACDNRCGGAAQCGAGQCQLPDGGVDASTPEDAQPPMDSGTPEDGGGRDVALPPLCMGPGSPEDCVCEIGQLKCGEACVFAGRDELNCGACGLRCSEQAECADAVCYCAEGECVRACDPPLDLCPPGRCVNLETDPDHCGGCGISCASGLCADAQCLGVTVGHVIVIGHDMSSARAAIRRLAGNAIFLPSANPLRIMLYSERSRPSAEAGILSAIEAMAAATGRAYEFMPGSAAVPPDISSLAVTFLLSQVNVFVIAAQADASDSVLTKNGEIWSRALRTFVSRGGVVVLFDGGGMNSGTYQILEQAGLFDANGRTPLSTRTLELTAPGDAVASFVPLVYQSEGQTVGFDSHESTVVVRDPDTGLPVVVHIAR